MLEFLLCVCCAVWLFSQLGKPQQEQLKEKAKNLKDSLK